MRKSADFRIFLLTLLQFLSSNGKEEHFEHKGVIEIILIDEILVKFLYCEDGSNGTTSLVCTAHSGFIHILWCGLLFYPTARAMREASSIG